MRLKNIKLERKNFNLIVRKNGIFKNFDLCVFDEFLLYEYLRAYD